MASAYILVIACGFLALGYGVVTSRSVLAADAGNARMQEISGAVQVGANAYLNRQYRTIAVVGVVVLIILGAIWPLMIQTMYGVQDVDPVARDTARVYGLGRLRTFRLVVAPTAEYTPQL